MDDLSTTKQDHSEEEVVIEIPNVSTSGIAEDYVDAGSSGVCKSANDGKETGEFESKAGCFTTGEAEGFSDTDSIRDSESTTEGKETDGFVPKAGCSTGRMAESYSDNNLNRGFGTANTGQEMKQFESVAACSTAGIAEGYSDTDSSRDFESKSEGQEIGEFEPKAGCSTEMDFSAKSSSNSLVEITLSAESGESSESIANMSVHQVAENARKASIAARKAANSCWAIMDGIRKATNVSRKRASQSTKKGFSAADDDLHDMYYWAARTFSTVAWLANRRIRSIEEAATAAETAACAAERAANDLFDIQSESFNDIQEKIDLAVHATKDANDRAVVAVQNEYLAHKMMRCWPELDDAEPLTRPGLRFPARMCSIPEFKYWECGRWCKCKICTVILVMYAVGCGLMILAETKPVTKGWALALSMLVLFVPIFLTFIKLVLHLIRKKRHRRRRNRRNTCLRILQKVDELEAYFASNGIEFEHLSENDEWSPGSPEY